MAFEFLRPLTNLVANMVARAVVRTVDDSKSGQELQIEMLSGEVRNDVERLEEYGFTSNPPIGAEAVAVCVGGRREHAVVIATRDRRYRLTNLESGEVAVYNDTGAKIVMKASGDIEATPASGKAFKVTGNATISGTLDVTGNLGCSATVTAATDVVGGGKHLKTHVHSYTDADTASGGSGGTKDTAAPS